MRTFPLIITALAVWPALAGAQVPAAPLTADVQPPALAVPGALPSFGIAQPGPAPYTYQPGAADLQNPAPPPHAAPAALPPGLAGGGVPAPLTQVQGYAVATPAAGAAANVDLGLRHKAWAGRPRNKKVVSDGYAEFSYKQGMVMRIAIAQNLPATIMLPPWEKITQQSVVPGVGPELIEVRVMSPNTLEVRIRRVGFGTNLKIYGTSGQIYFFYIDALPHDTDTITETAVAVRADPPFLGDLTASDLTSYTASPALAQTPAAAPGKDDPRLRFVLDHLPVGLREAIPDPSRIRVPHNVFEGAEGDAAAIGPVRVVEDGTYTYFDFGDAAGNRPRPAISYRLDGVDRPSARFYVHPSFPQIVIADKVGDFTMRWEGRTVCIERSTRDPFAGVPAPGSV